MNSSPSRCIALIALIVATSSCDRGEPARQTPPAEGGDAPSNRIDIPATVRSNLGITFAKVERRHVAETIRVPGSFELKPRARHEYRLMLPAQVRFEVDQFETVAPGTLLYRFQSPDWLALRSRIDLAAAAHQQASTKHEALAARLTALARADFKRADLEAEAAGLQSEAARQQAELNAVLSSAANILNSYAGPDAPPITPDDLLTPSELDGRPVPRYQQVSWIEVKAAGPGVVESLAVTDGSFVDATTLVLTTVDPGMIRFRALGLQSDLPMFENAPSVRIAPHQSDHADLNDSLPAKLTLGLDANPAQRTITLFADPLESRPWARPGLSAFLEVTTAVTAGPALAIPRSAVVKDGLAHVFFKRDPQDPNKAIRVEADLGIDDGRWVEVKSDLGPTDEVVFEGAYELMLASAQSGTSQKGGHFHADGTYHGKH